MIRELRTIAEVRNINAGSPFTRPIREWKEQGGKVVAYQCNYVPEEVIWGAGALPVRMAGDFYREMELGDADSYLYITTCSFCRSCLQLALLGRYDFLDGYISGATCDGSRRLADIWRQYIKHIPLIHTLTVPRKMTEGAPSLYNLEIQGLKDRLEEHFKVKITHEILWDAIKLYNRTRELLLKLYETRKADNPPISGSEIMELINAGLRMPRDKYNELLERLLDEIESGNRTVNGSVRLMISGSPLNNPELLKAIEAQGGLVVIDELCMTTSYWLDPIDTSYPGPLEAISDRYLNKFPCARMVPYDNRFNKIFELVKEYRVDGMIAQLIRHCAPYSHDQPLLREKLEAMGVPVLELDVEYGMGGTGQIKTRVQAFLEILMGKESKDLS